MDISWIMTLLMGYLAPVQSLSLLPEYSGNSTIPTNLWFLLTIHSRIAIVAGFVLFFIVGGISVGIYYYFCNGKQHIQDDLRRRNARKVADLNAAEEARRPVKPPSYDQTTADKPPTYSNADLRKPDLSITHVRPITEDSELPPPYEGPMSGATASSTTDIEEEPPAYSNSPVQDDLPCVI